MQPLLITGGLIVSMDARRRVIENGSVAVQDGTIVGVGDAAEVAPLVPGARVIDATGMAVLPGFIDVHAHAGHGLVKTMGGGNAEAWGRAVQAIYYRGSTPAFWGAEGALSALERLMCGVTTGLSIFGSYGYRGDDPAYPEAQIAAYASVGVRNVIAVGIGRRPFPNSFVRWEGDVATETSATREEQLAVCETIIARHHGGHDGRTMVMLGAPLWYPGQAERDPQLVGMTLEDIAEVRALSRRSGVGFTQDAHRRGTVRAIHAIGALGPDALLSHCIDIDADEIAMIAETGTKVAHNPSANYSIRGRCPAIELMDAGAVVAIASDGTAPDRSYDMFRHMWQAMHYHRRHFRDEMVFPPGKALEMVTIDAASALGLAHRIGSIEVGKQADVILVDLAKPHLYPPNMPLYRLVCFAVGSDVDTVIVGGKVLMEKRRVLSVDPAAVLEAARIETEKAIARTGLHDLLATPAGFWGGTRYAGSARA
ncbi:amidohydrolase family protein [Elioraea sp.]|uniref:amidohydrolase family protein n=1 Tax=Elioraea sp. TaxID=2185103 RepID=UPI0025B9D147|nr:amidohydrolase family protein [Elioraea sp.]